MTASPVTAPAPTGYPALSDEDLRTLRAIQHRRATAALVFAQETMNNREDAAARAFADYYEASVEHQLAWTAAMEAAHRKSGK